MSVRNLGYDGELLDSVFCYFMRTVLQLQTHGVEHLPVHHSLPEPWGPFLDTAMGIFLDSPPPELARLLLDGEHDAVLSRGPVSVDTALGLRLIKELTWHIHYDADLYRYLLATENIWGNTALEYASLTFYPNLPEDIKRRYRIQELIQHIPESMFRLDDY